MREVRITEIQIKGTIIPNDDKSMYDWYDIESTCPNDVAKALEQAGGEDVDIYINSGGGEIFAATEIYSAVQKYKGNVKLHVTGLAASAASIIMCAGECDISATSMVMIHNVSSMAQGNYRDFKHESETLRKADKAMCQAYVNKTGKSEGEILPLMDKETWFTAQEAVDLGLCDRVVGRETLVNAYCSIVTDQQRNEYIKAAKKAKAQLRLEKIKGDVKI